jgi:2-oxoglutarate dehydrogenase E1 component
LRPARHTGYTEIMDRDPALFGGSNVLFVEEIYRRFLEDPSSVAPDWRAYFEGLDGQGNGKTNGNGRRRVIVETALEVAAGPSPRPFADPRIPFLESIGLFRDVPRDELAHIAQIAEEEKHASGSVIFHQGDEGQNLYVVAEGEVLIKRKGRIIAALGPGEVVGELAVIDHLPRSADAEARGSVRLLRIKGDDLLALLDNRPVLARGLIRVLSKRLRETGARQDLVDQLIRAYRVRGHLHADLNPLEPPSRSYPELDPAFYGFTPQDMDMVFSSTTIPGTSAMTLRDIIALLDNTYCRSIGVQFMHIDDMGIKDWLQERMESTQNQRGLTRDEQIRILTKLTDAEIFEQFIHAKFVGAKRFSLEGAESLIPLLDMAIELAAQKGTKEIVIGMAHRGRLNVLANVMGKSARQIFREFDDRYNELNRGTGDVKYHLGYSSDRTTAAGQKVHLSLAFNPSHLEFVSPVAIGRVRAKQQRYADHDYTMGMPIIIHGDAAFAGQGVVQEMLNMSELDGYSTGGTLHIVVNNQIGFTTNPLEGRSTKYATDVARMLQIPIFHVNGEHPEPVAQVIQLAMDFRERWKKDVVIDLYCYRRHGHNEGDEPAFTQPRMYELIKKKRSVRESYIDSLEAMGGLTREEADQIAVRRRQALEEDLGKARSPAYTATIELNFGLGVWRPYRGGPDQDEPDVETKVPRERLSKLLVQLATVPEDFHPHPKIARLLRTRAAMATGEPPLDWAAGEALAFATLLTEGAHVRLSGQDSARGTFSHRHSVLHDVENGSTYTPLQHLDPAQAAFDVYNSPLTEIAVLGFEYGYSLDFPEALTLWEAQFGDFANVAQVIIDQFISSGEDKWRRLNGLVLLLPHGFEGQGPEHSSARLERFLQLAAEDNMQIANLTTPAQLFHCLRRQVVRPYRKPLVIMSPKSLLRHPEATSSLEDLAAGSFQRIMPDARARDPRSVERVLLVSGKLSYELEALRRDKKREDKVAIVRIEQLYPFSMPLFEQVIAPYPKSARFFWVQEEPENMGAWTFIERTLRGRGPISVIARLPSASPATGSLAAHKKEQQEIIEAAVS